MGGSISFHNRTEIPLVFVISQVGPLYWGVLQPGEDAIRNTGRVWFSIDIFPYDGSNEPTHTEAVLSIAVPIGLAIASGVTAGLAAIPAAGSAAAALSPLVASSVVPEAISAGVTTLAPAVVKALVTPTRPISLKGFYVGGDEHVTIVGGPTNGDKGTWQPIRMA